MKVRELIESLSKIDPERVVVLESLTFGSRRSIILQAYARLESLDDNAVITSDDTVLYERKTEDNAKTATSEDFAEPGEGEPCVVLVPAG